MDPQNPAEKRSSMRNDKQTSNAKNSSNKVTLQDIQVVQNLIERCLQLYMSRAEVVSTLLDRARIEPEFTELVWQKLEAENAEFFKAYHMRLKLKDQIDMYNQLLEKQYNLMKQQEHVQFHPTPVQHDMHHMPVNNLSMEYPMKLNVTPSTGYSELYSVGTISACSGVNGMHASENIHHMQQNYAKGGLADAIPSIAAGNMKLEHNSSPAELASNGQTIFSPDSSVLDPAFTCTEELERMSLGVNGVDGQNTYCALQASDQTSYEFDFSNTNTAEWSEFQEFGPVENYSGSNFQPPEISLDSAEQLDFVDYFLDEGSPGQVIQQEESKPK